MNNVSWEVLDHTSDLEIVITGASEEKLFENAAQALSAQIAEPEDIGKVAERSVQIEAESPEERFLDWLRELLYLSVTQGFLVGEVKNVGLSCERNCYKAEAVVRGEETDANRHRLLHEVKTVTYQDFFYGKTEGCWKARVVFDV